MDSRRSDLRWDYDERSDVLYISFGEPVPAYGERLDENLLLRRSPQDDAIVGLTVLAFREMGGIDALLQRLRNSDLDLPIPLTSNEATAFRADTREPVSS